MLTDKEIKIDDDQDDSNLNKQNINITNQKSTNQKTKCKTEILNLYTTPKSLVKHPNNDKLLKTTNLTASFNNANSNNLSKYFFF